MIEPGDPLPNLGIDVYDSTGVLAAAGLVVLTITLPDGTTTQPAVTIAATGQYRATYTPATVGRYVARWVATGANAGVQEDVYDVEQFNGLVSLAEVKQHLNIRVSTTDDLLRGLILQASDLAEGPEGTCRVWRRLVITDEVHAGWWGGGFQLNSAPVASITGVTIDGVSTPDFAVRPNGRLELGGSGAGSYGSTVKVSYVTQGGPVPAGLRTGVLELVRHLHAMHRGGSGVPRQEEPDWTAGAGYLIPNRVAMSFRAYSASGLG